MPIYSGTLSVPAGTTSDSPATADVTVDEWVIVRFDVMFPSGCAGLVHAAVFYGSEQLAPRPTGASFIGNYETISWPESWRCPEKPCTVQFRGWAPSAIYDHNLQVRVVTLPSGDEELLSLQKEYYKLAIDFYRRVIGV